jgi:hypothetical protein
MSNLYDEVKAIVDNFDKAGTATELDHALLDIILHCATADAYGDDVTTADIRQLVTDRLGECDDEA